MLQSNLLSGGLDLENIGVLKPESQTQLRKFAKLSGDKEILKALETPAPDKSALYAVIHQGTDEAVDLTINCLQKICMRNPKIMGRAVFGGADGMRITRAAYAVILQFSDLGDEWRNCQDAVELERGEDGEEAAIIGMLKEDYPQVITKFEHATKMRPWISETKKDLNEKLTAQLKKKRLSEKKETYKKAEEEKKATKKEDDDQIDTGGK
jgi:hypothetical protein